MKLPGQKQVHFGACGAPPQPEPPQPELVVQWEGGRPGSGLWTNYRAAELAIITACVRGGQPSCTLTIGGQLYTLDLKRLTQTNERRGCTRQIRMLGKVAPLPEPAAANPKPAEAKPAAAKPASRKRVLLSMLIDRSGSMQTMGSEVSGGINAYLEEQKADDAKNTNSSSEVLVATFDNAYEKIRDGVPLATIEAVTDAEVRPRGGTALFDAIGQCLEDTEHRAKVYRADDVIVFILTDGQENQSQRWNSRRVQARIDACKKKGWTFFFAAANQDALATGAGFGVEGSHCISFGANRQDMRAAFGACSAQASACKAGFGGGFSASQRAKTMQVEHGPRSFGNGPFSHRRRPATAGYTVSAHASGNYAAGWFCDQCRTGGVAGTERWHCSQGEQDLCFACHPRSAGPPAPPATGFTLGTTHTAPPHTFGQWPTSTGSGFNF